MAKGFKDSKGKFRPTSSNSKSSKSKSTKPDGLMLKPTSKREKFENKSLQFQLDRIQVQGETVQHDIDIDPKLFLQAVQNDPNWTPAFGENSVRELKKRLEEGKQIDKPFIILLRLEDTEFNVKNGKVTEKKIPVDEIVGHQGRHRAFTARELGIKSIPVEVYCKKDKVTLNCNKIDEEVIKNALPQFPNSKQDEEEKKDFQKNLEGGKKFLKRLKKIKNPRSDQEQIIFELGFDIKNTENVVKISDEMAEKRKKKRKKIKEIFN